MDPDPIGNDTAAGVWVVILAYGVFFGVVLLFSYLLTAITLMFFFRKVGVAPGIAWVPIFNTWTWLRVGGQPGPIALLALTPAAIVVRIFLALAMYRIDLAHLCWSLENLAAGTPVNVIHVDEDTQKWSLVALERMLQVV